MEESKATPFRFTWRINNFSKLTEKKLYSEVFCAGGCNWRLLIFPKGNNVDFLSIYLAVADSTSLPQGWSRDAKFSLAVVNQFNNTSTVRKDTKHVFNALEDDWGFTSFIPLSKVKNPAEGYLVADTLIVEAEVLVYSVQHYSRLDPKKGVASSETKLSEPVAAPPTKQVPLSQKEIFDTEAKVVPPTVTETPLTTKPLKETKEPIQTTTATGDQEVIKSSQPPSKTAETMIPPKDPPEARKSSPDVHTISKGLQTELSNRTRTQRSPSSSEISMSNQAPNPEVVQKQKETLEGYFNMPLEAIQQANAYGSIEGIINALIQNSNDLREKTILEDLLSRLAEFKESIPAAATIAEAAQARRTSLSGKTTDLDARLAQRQKKLSFLETEFSRLSKEEEKLEAQIQLLITQKEKIVANKKHVLADLEKNNEDATKDLEEWRNLESEIKQANVDWLGAKEKLALANVRWKLFKEDLGLGKLNIS
ncbi:MATH domain and coiled-coil domain-containing protein At3g58270-like isoform X2 [Hevea brasiliensis]|uniref:MATH domain and coiled-coil domain-containing protein At3g58270-like isoform X2 n=1 Tax=Hevea brasiliensis TaxID=3981 RepID=UPI0025FDBF5C|nr:MATH domain and coiled-coil domain-containing protein At3g58270-like isoform X2 [Hevea brasiliensis]